MAVFVGFDTVSKGPFHNYYGVWNQPNGAQGPTIGPGVPAHELGDLYYNSNAGQAGLWVCTTAGSPGTWQQLGFSSLDKRESKYIVGNSANGDTLNNSDYLDGGGIRSAIIAVGASSRHGGRIYIREGAYTAPAPNVGFQVPYQLSEAAAPNHIQNGIWIDGAGRTAVTITNPGTNNCGLFILDYAGATELMFPVMMSHMTLVGNGNVGPDIGAGQGYGTVEVGFSDQYGNGGASPKCKKYVELVDIEINGGGAPPTQGGDYCALVLVDDSGNAGGTGASSYFKGTDLIIHRAGGAPAAPNPPSPGQVWVNPYYATATNPCYEFQLLRCKIYDSTDIVNSGAAGFYGSYLYGSSIVESTAGVSGFGNQNGGWILNLCEDVALEGCRAVGNTYETGGSTAGFYLITCVNCRLVNCYASRNLGADNAGDDYLLDTCVDCLLESCVSDGTREIGCNNNGITLIVCTSCVVSGCNSHQHTDTTVATPAAGHGFVMSSGLYNEFVGCVTTNAPGTPNNTRSGFYVSASVRCSLNDCVSALNWGNGGVGQLQVGHGFLVTGVSEYILVNDCQTHYNGSGLGGGVASYGVYLDTSTVRCEVVGGAHQNNSGALGGIYDPNVYDAVGGTTTNELSHFQWK